MTGTVLVSTCRLCMFVCCGRGFPAGVPSIIVFVWPVEVWGSRDISRRGGISVTMEISQGHNQHSERRCYSDLGVFSRALGGTVL